MSRSKPTRECEEVLRYNGYSFNSQDGSHIKYKNDSGNHIIITCKGVNEMVWERLVKQNKLIVPKKVKGKKFNKVKFNK